MQADALVSIPPARRIPELDGLRGLAALAVIFYHGCPRTGTRLDTVLGLGWTAVDLFFLLSGYLITGILLAGRPDRSFLGAFYARRSLRIWPLYYLALAAVVALAALAPAAFPPFSRATLAAYATYTQQIPGPWAPAGASYRPLGHFWSLAVEEQFYLFWPPVVLLGGRRAVVPASVALLALCLSVRFGVGDARYLLVGRCDGLAYGAVLAVVLDPARTAAGRRRLARPFAALVGASALGILAWWRLDGASLLAGEAILLPAVPLFFGLVGLVICLEGRPATAPLRARPLVSLGTISYGLYVYHWPVFVALDRLSRTGPSPDRHPYGEFGVGMFLLGLAITSALAVASWSLFERPILRLKGRFEYRGRGRGRGRGRREGVARGELARGAAALVRAEMT